MVCYGDFIHLIAAVWLGFHGHGVARFGIGGCDGGRTAALAGFARIGFVGGRGISAAAGIDGITAAALGLRDLKIDGLPSNVLRVGIRHPEYHGVGPHLGGRLGALIGCLQPAGVADLQVRRHCAAVAVLDNQLPRVALHGLAGIGDGHARHAAEGHRLFIAGYDLKGVGEVLVVIGADRDSHRAHLALCCHIVEQDGQGEGVQRLASGGVDDLRRACRIIPRLSKVDAC